MKVHAKHKFARISAQKCRLVCDQIRGKRVEEALSYLQFCNKKAAGLIKKVLESAIANAEHNNGADIDDLKISRIFADNGPAFKRMHARAKGRGTQILKQTCHLTVELTDGE